MADVGGEGNLCNWNQFRKWSKKQGWDPEVRMQAFLDAWLEQGLWCERWVGVDGVDPPVEDWKSSTL